MEELYLALVRNNMVRTIAVGDAEFVAYAESRYDYVIDVTNHTPRPVQGDSYYPETGQFISNTQTETPLTCAELDPAIPEGTAESFAPFPLSQYSVSFADHVVTVGCRRYGAKGLLQALYEVLVENETTVEAFHTMSTGPAHGKYGITWDDATLLYNALTSLQRSVL